MPAPLPFRINIDAEETEKDGAVDTSVDNRRNSDRVPWQQVTSIQALDQNGDPVGDPITAISNDLRRERHWVRLPCTS